MQLRFQDKLFSYRLRVKQIKLKLDKTLKKYLAIWLKEKKKDDTLIATKSLKSSFSQFRIW